MKKRPTSVTVISWFLIISAPLVLITMATSLRNPAAKDIMSRSLLPMSVQYLMLFLGLAISLTSGIAMLKGRNWGRFLYVAWSIFGLITGLITSPFKAALLPSIVMFLVMAFFLFRPKANDYFRADSSETILNGQENN